MNKREWIAAFAKRLEQDLQILKAAALATYEEATHEESKAESQYDTRGLEASYLAGAQAKRVAEMEEVLQLFRSLAFVEFGPDSTVQLTALVELTLDGKKSTVLIMPKGGGVALKHGEQVVQIVTPNSSLGEALMDLRVGESADFEAGDRLRECSVLGIC